LTNLLILSAIAAMCVLALPCIGIAAGGIAAWECCAWVARASSVALAGGEF
jgi:hypothetical protein